MQRLRPIISSSFGKLNASSSLSRRCINSSALTVTPSTGSIFENQPSEMPPKESLTFGTTFAPHMLNISYNNDDWAKPEIIPYGKISITPGSACLNYGMTCFEGALMVNIKMRWTEFFKINTFIV